MPRRKTPRERARSAEAKQELRDRILREATGLFVEVGYREFSMRRLAARIGYTAPTIYGYFRNKDELLFEVIALGYAQLQAYLQRGSGAGAARLAQLGAAYLDFAFEQPEMYKLIFMHRPHFLFDLDEARVAERSEGLQVVARTMASVPGWDALPEAERRRLAEIFWAQLHGLVSLALTVPILSEQWARENLRFLLEKLALTPGRG